MRSIGWLCCVVAWATNANCSNPPRRREQNCGVLLSQLTVACGSAKHSRPKWCCRALLAWNDAMCWCEKNALHAAANVAMDEYAFQLRIGHCNVTSFFHDDIALPNSAKRVLRSTCGGVAAHMGRGDEEGGCASEKCASLLRLLRIDSLYRLQQLDVVRDGDISEWSAQLDGLFAVDAWLYSIGVSFSFPRTNVKRYLLQRSTLLRGALWKGDIYADTITWKGNKQVSYAAVTDIGDYSFSRFVFVEFERCSSRVRSVAVQEEEAVGHFRQFVYVDPADRHMWSELRSAQRWCKEVTTACEGALFPYDSFADCVWFGRELKMRQQVTCARHGERSSVVALHGDTLSCRGLYLRLAAVDKRFCRMLGRRALGRCRSAGCARGRYNDILQERNPRYESTNGYVCAREQCLEQWPARR